MFKIKFLFLLIALGSFQLTGQDLSSRYQESIKSVVTIFTTEFKISNGVISPSKSLGSGVIIDTSGYILTAAHVVETANVIQIKLHNDVTYDAEVIRTIPSSDIAMVKITEPVTSLHAAPLLEGYEDLKIGHQVYVIGAPLGIEQSLSSGYVSGFLQRNMMANGNFAKFIQTDAAINQGNSGGPMFDMNGKVVGIVSFILSQSGGFDGIGYAVDIQTAKKFLLEDDSYFWSGFDGYFLDANLAAILNVPQKAGVLIQRISKNSFADQMGMKGGFFQAQILDQQLWLGGDIILEILGAKCDGPHSLKAVKKAIQLLEKGDSIEIKVLRKGKILDLVKKI